MQSMSVVDQIILGDPALWLSGDLFIKTVMEEFPDPIFFKDRNGRFIYANKAKSLQHGISDPARMIGKTDYDLFPAVMAEEIHKADRQVMESGLPVISRMEKHIGPDGRTAWTSVSKSPICGKGDEIIGIWGISRELTEAERAKSAMAFYENKYRVMIENISDVIVLLDQNGVVRFISPNISSNFGWNAGEVIGSSGFSLIHPDDREKTLLGFSSLLEHPGVFKTMECRLQCKDGHFHDIEIIGRNLLNDPEIEGILLHYHDISERKRRDEEVRYLSYHDVMTEHIAGSRHENRSRPVDRPCHQSGRRLYVPAETSGARHDAQLHCQFHPGGHARDQQ